MKSSLVDLNVWLSLVVIQHEHHSLAIQWFDRLTPSEAGMCRFAQLGLMRLLASPVVMSNHAIAPIKAWDLIGTLLEDERVELLPEPKDLDIVLPSLLHYRIPTGKLIGDAYLAAFAISADLRLVTLDRGFRQFRDLDVHFLNA